MITCPEVDFLVSQYELCFLNVFFYASQAIATSRLFKDENPSYLASLGDSGRLHPS